MARPRMQYTDAEKQAKLDRARELIAQGKTRIEACKEAGIQHSLFYKWQHQLKERHAHPPKTKLKRKSPAPYFEEVAESPTPEDKKIACLIGTPAAIGEVLRGMK